MSNDRAETLIPHRVSGLASISSRATAKAIDLLIVGFVFFLLDLAFNTSFIVHGQHVERHPTFSATVVCIAFFLYGALMESSSRQATIGKLLVGIIVVDAAGTRIMLRAALTRGFVQSLSATVLFAGHWWAVFTEGKQGLHDLAAGTFVIPGTLAGRPLREFGHKTV